MKMILQNVSYVVLLLLCMQFTEEQISKKCFILVSVRETTSLILVLLASFEIV